MAPRLLLVARHRLLVCKRMGVKLQLTARLVEMVGLAVEHTVQTAVRTGQTVPLIAAELPEKVREPLRANLAKQQEPCILVAVLELTKQAAMAVAAMAITIAQVMVKQTPEAEVADMAIQPAAELVVPESW